MRVAAGSLLIPLSGRGTAPLLNVDRRASADPAVAGLDWHARTAQPHGRCMRSTSSRRSLRTLLGADSRQEPSSAPSPSRGTRSATKPVGTIDPTAAHGGSLVALERAVQLRIANDVETGHLVMPAVPWHRPAGSSPSPACVPAGLATRPATRQARSSLHHGPGPAGMQARRSSQPQQPQPWMRRPSRVPST